MGFLPFGYLFSILIETPILLVGLSAHHPVRQRLFAGVWLTACTYPIVVLVLPLCIDITESRTLYLWVAETFAPVAEWPVLGGVRTPRPRGDRSMCATSPPSHWPTWRPSVSASCSVPRLFSRRRTRLTESSAPAWSAPLSPGRGAKEAVGESLRDSRL